MSETQYRSPIDSKTLDAADFTAQWAGSGARLLAYLIDVLPITIATAAFFYLFLGFDETFQRYSTAPGNLDARIDFLTQRNQIRHDSQNSGDQVVN